MSQPMLDTSDIDQYLGKPIDSSTIREPIGNNDIRRWVHAMHYPNLLHYDPAFAAASRWGQLVAPQSFAIAVDDGHGSAPACVGRIPNSHLLFGGDEWWFYPTRVVGGDMLSNERIPFDYVVKETKFAGPTCFQRGDNFYRNQKGDLIAKQRSTIVHKPAPRPPIPRSSMTRSGAIRTSRHWRNASSAGYRCFTTWATGSVGGTMSI